MEPERKIEKWLRAYAKKRRGQTGDSFKIHPATRRLLQSEISRNAPKAKNGDETIPFWQAIRQMWGFLLGFAVCVFLLAAIFLQSLIETKKKAEFGSTINSLSQIGSTVQMAANNKELSDLTNQSSSQLALARTTTPQLAERNLQMEPTAAPAPASSPPGGTYFQQVKSQDEESTQAFASLDRKKTFEEDAFKDSISASRTNPVLMNFQLQRNGNVIRMVDGDGSVYSGSLASSAGDTVLAEVPASGPAYDGQMLKTGNFTMRTASPAAISRSRQTAKVYSFRVNGINRTLKQNVEFTGSLVIEIAAAQPEQQAFGASARLEGTAGNVRSQEMIESTNQTGIPPVPTLRVAGTVIINQTNQIEINAAQIMPAKN